MIKTSVNEAPVKEEYQDETSIDRDKSLKKCL